jgi:hypothetical protein
MNVHSYSVAAAPAAPFTLNSTHVAPTASNPAIDHLAAGIMAAARLLLPNVER